MNASLMSKRIPTDKLAHIKEVRIWELLKRGYRKPYIRELDHFIFFTNKAIEKVEFDFCCHPKAGDDIVAFYRRNRAVIHHKLCRKAYQMMKDGEPMLFVQWRKSKIGRYRLIVALQNQKGVLAKLLSKISKLDINVLGIEMGINSGENAEYCKIEVESERLGKKEIARAISGNFKLIEIAALDDAYNSR